MRFGMAHTARSIGWSITDLLLAWHIHVVIGMDGRQTGMLLFAFLFTGGLANLVFGSWLTRTRATSFIYVRAQLVGALGAAPLLVAQFLVVTPAMVVAVGIAFRITFALQDVPQNALAALLPVNAAEAGIYARLRVMLSAAARLLVIGVGLAMAGSFSAVGVSLALGITATAMVGTAVGLLGVRFPPQAEPIAMKRQSTGGPSGLARLLMTFGVAGALLPTLNRLMIFSPATVATPGLGGWLLAAFCLGTMAGPFVGRWISTAFSERHAVAIVLLTIIGSGLLLIAPGLLWPRLIGAGVHGMALGAVGARLWSSASAVAMATRRNGQTGDGLVFGSVIFVTHLSMALGMLLAGPLIEGVEAGRASASLTALAITSAGVILIAGLGLSRRTVLATA